MLGEQRKQAFWRVIAMIYAVTLASLLTFIVAIVGTIWGIVDVIWQAITNRNDLSAESRPAKIVGSTLRWNVDLIIYALVGYGGLMWLPEW